ncbi:MAG: HAD-IIA family hydrolase [Candidatus Thorarchaeota archaeon]
MFENVTGILSDIDGTLYFKGKPTPGAIETVSEIHKKGLKLLFFTNTDSKSPQLVLKTLKSYGFGVNSEEVYTPIIALKEFLNENLDKKSYFITTKEVKKEFQEFPKVEGSEIPDFVILCDFHDNWDVSRLNQAFKYVLKGAKLIGSQGNIYYLDRNGEPVLDTGTFISMISNASNSPAKIFGKPSKQFFEQALKKINSHKNEVIVIGDDVFSDIQGAKNSGLKGILVKTGKGRLYDRFSGEIEPDLVIENFSRILDYI